MNVELRFFATFRQAVGQKTLEREFPDDSSVGDVLRELEADYEGLDGQLLENGELRPQINVLLNGREVLHMESVDTAVEDGDTLSIFPPVAGGSEESWVTREKSFRGISVRLARNYLENLGGEAVADDRVEGDDWAASLSAEKAGVGPSLTLTEVTVVFEGNPESLETLIPDFSQKAMRAGG